MLATPIRSILRIGTLALVAVSLLAACGGQQPVGQSIDAGETTTSTAGSATPGTEAGSAPQAAGTATDGADGPFCVALVHFIDLDANAAASYVGPMLGSLTPEELGYVNDTLLPALQDLSAATPAELREPVDFLIEMVTSVTLSPDDPNRSTALIDLLSGGGVDYDTYHAFMTLAADSCRLDAEQISALRSNLGAPPKPEDSCGPPRADEPTMDGEERLLTVDDVTSIKAFKRNCPRMPDFTPDDRALSSTGPCGDDLPDLDVTAGPVATYGIGFSNVIELLVEPGAAAAANYVEALQATTITGCGLATVTANDGTTRTTSDVVVVDLDGVDDPHLAYTAHVATTANLGTQTGIPLELETAFVAVQHGDELLILIATEQEPIPTDSLNELTAAAIRRTGW